MSNLICGEECLYIYKLRTEILHQLETTTNCKTRFWEIPVMLVACLGTSIIFLKSDRFAFRRCANYLKSHINLSKYLSYNYSNIINLRSFGGSSFKYVRRVLTSKYHLFLALVRECRRSSIPSLYLYVLIVETPLILIPTYIITVIYSNLSFW